MLTSHHRRIFVRAGFYLFLLCILILPITPTLALFSGLIFAILFENPFPELSRKASKYTLQIAVVGLGFSIKLHEAVETGVSGMGLTFITVALVMMLGMLVGKWLRLSKATAYLISAGTAICGGSAIAAVAPVIRANEVETSVSLSVIFILNAVGLLVFPPLGHFFYLSPHQFGVWAAIAIHDTSSVVGAGAAYGPAALKVATTIKLTRALWIIPLTFLSTILFRNKNGKITVPWFILLFFGVVVVQSVLQIPSQLVQTIVHWSHKLLTITLFLIGSGLTRSAIRSTGIRPLLASVLLWLFIGTMSLTVIYLAR